MPETSASGGFEYEIKVLTNLEALEDFRQELAATAKELDRIAKSAKDRTREAAAATKAGKAEAADLRAKAKVARDAAAAVEVETAALKKLEAAAFNKQVADKAARIEKQNSFDITRQAASQAQNEQRVLAKLVKVYDKQAQALIALAQSKEFAANESLRFSAAELRAAGVLDQTTLQIAAARDKLAKTQASSQDQVFTIQTEAKALALVNAELLKQAAIRRSLDISRGTGPQEGPARAPGFIQTAPEEQARRESELAALREDIQKRSAAQFEAFEKETTRTIQAENKKREADFAASEKQRVTDLRVAIQQRAAIRAQFEAEEVGRGAERARQAFEAEQAINREQQLAIRQRLEEQAALRSQFDAEEINRASERARAAVAAEDAARAKELQGIRERLQKEEQLRDAFNREEIQRASERARAAQAAEDQARTGEQQLIRQRLEEEAALRQEFARENLARNAKLAENAFAAERTIQEKQLAALKANIIERTGVTASSEKQLESIRNRANNRAQLDQNALIEVEQRRLAIAQQAITQQRLREAGLIRETTNTEKLKKSVGGVEKVAKQLLFTFRRLVGVLAIFTLARKAAQAFTNSIRAAVQFNSKLEQSAIAIASLVVASGTVTNAFGEAVNGGEALALAIGKAKQQQTLLRQDALFTAATYEQLVDAYQTAIAPGLQVGFDLDQIRKFTVQISQAATAIGLPQQQLAEEIRSLLQGTIRARDTRIAVSLGITNQDIKRAKELGQLSEFLDSRFRSFNDAAEAAQNTFALLASNTRDALVQLAGFAGAGFFDELKLILGDIRGSITEISEETGNIELSPDAIDTMGAFFGILEEGAKQFRILLSSFSSDNLQNIAEGLRTSFSLLFTTLRITLQGILQGFGFILSEISELSTIVIQLGRSIKKSLGGDSLEKALILFISIASAVGALNLILFTTTTIFSKFGAFILPLGLLKTSLLVLKDIVTGLVPAFATLNVTAGTTTALLGGMAKAALATLVAFLAVRSGVKSLELIEELDRAQKALIRLDLNLKKLEKRRVAGVFKDPKDDANYKKTIEAIDEFQKKFDDLGIDPKKFDAGDVLDVFTTFGKQVKADLNSIVESFGIDFSNAAEDAAKKAGAISENLDLSISSITAANRELGEQQNLIQTIEESIKSGNIELRAQVETLGASSAVSEQRVNVAKALYEIQKASKEIIVKIAQEEASIFNAEQRRLRNAREIAALSAPEQGVLATTQRLILNINQAEERLLKNKKDQQLAQLALNTLQDSGSSEERRKAEKELQTLKEKEERLVYVLNQQRKALNNKIAEGAAAGKLSAQELLDLAKESLELAGEIEAREQNILGLKDQQAKLAASFLNKAAQENFAIAVKETFEITKQNRELAIQANAQRALVELRNKGFVDPNKEAIIGAREELAIQRLRKQEIIEQNNITQAGLDVLISENRFNAFGLGLMAQKTARQQQYNQQLDLQNSKIALARKELEQLKLIDERPFFAGSLEAIRNFIETSGSTFQQTFNVLQSAFTGFANTVGATIASIFDPTNTQSAKERWGRFLLALVQQAISALISIAIAQKILVPWLDAIGKTGGSSDGISGAADSGHFSKEGGPVPSRARAYPAHFMNPTGLALGGNVLKNMTAPPNQVDTVPLWAQPGEFMMRLSAVKKYGTGIMHAINSGLIDAASLKGLVSSRSFGRRQSSIPRRGYQTGGEIQQGLSRLASDRESSGGGGSGGGPQLGFMLASENQMEMMLRGGKNAFMRFLSENSSSVNRFLGR